MNVTDFTYFLEHPTKVVEPIHTKHLEDIIEEYPYFQAARALHLKGLKNLNSYKYNKALKITAAYTTDRDVLFDFITSKDFLQHDVVNIHKNEELPADPEITVKEAAPLIAASDDKPLPQDEKDAEQILDPELFKTKEPETEPQETKEEETQTLELGRPLPFDAKEKYSFSEWLNLTSKEPIARKAVPIVQEEKRVERPKTKLDPSKKKKFDRIDKFIATNPKIVPTQNQPSIEIANTSKIDASELMTETLARVYLEQKKYKKAVQAYKILSLKYPEKSSFFADRIKAVEKIKKENT